MSEAQTMFDDVEDPTQSKHKRHRGGIKNATFTATGNNGESHRRNAKSKHARYLINRRNRADLYSQFQGEKGWMENSTECKEWHMRLNALSSGGA